MNVEELILKVLEMVDVSEEMKLLESVFPGDFNPLKLQSELNILSTIPKTSAPVDFPDICSTLQEIDKEQCPLIENVWTII